MPKKRVKFPCQKCGAVHVFTEGDDGLNVELEAAAEDQHEEKPPKKKRERGLLDELDDFLTGKRTDKEDDD